MIHIGVVGIGRMGIEHIKNIQTYIKNAEVFAVCANHKEKLEQIAKQWNIPYQYTSFKEMCANDTIDAILIASPTAYHLEHIKIAREYKKHIFCEKPIGLDLESCKKIAKDINEESSHVFSLGFMRRFDSSYVKVKEKLDRGDIGRLILIRCYSQDPVANIKGAIQYASLSGGQFMDMSIHDIDLCHWFLPGRKVKTIHSIGGCYEYEEYAKWNDGDNVASLMQFDDGTMAFLFAGRAAAHGYNIETELIGTHGTLRVGSVGTDSMVEVLSEHGVCRECYPDFATRFKEAFLKEMQEFVSCIEEKKSPTCTAEDGVFSLEVAQACKESFVKGYTIQL